VLGPLRLQLLCCTAGIHLVCRSSLSILLPFTHSLMSEVNSLIHFTHSLHWSSAAAAG